MRFESKRDLWLVRLMRLIPIAALLGISILWYRSHHDVRGPLAGAVIVMLAQLFLFEWILRSTYYVIEGPALVIHCSWATWRVPIAEIRAVTPTRNALSSPALSLDRLRIDYGARSIMISPEDPQRFIESLRAIHPSIVA